MTDEAKKVDWETERKMEELKRHIKGLRITTFVTLFIALFGIGMLLMIRSSFDAPVDSAIRAEIQKEMSALESKFDARTEALAARVNSGPNVRAQLGGSLNTLEALAQSGDEQVRQAAVEAGKAMEKLIHSLK